MPRNPFLVARLVFFSILVYLNFLGIGFAAWNISAMKSAVLNVSGAPIFIIFNALSLFFFLAVALAELITPSARTAQVNFECGWTAILSVMQLAAAVDVTVNGPPAYCSTRAYLAVCSSSTVLVAISWASSTILLMYFLTLIITATTHSTAYGAVWSATVSNVPWFVDTQLARISFPPAAATEKPASPPKGPYENPVFYAQDNDEEAEGPLAPPNLPFASQPDYDLERQLGAHQLVQSHSQESLRPNWAKRVNTRRGVDLPFAPKPSATQRISRVLKSYWSGVTTVPPTPPPKPSLPIPSNLNGGFIDCHRTSYGHFPDDVTDHDLPIAQTRLSEWVRAERAVLAH